MAPLRRRLAPQFIVQRQARKKKLTATGFAGLFRASPYGDGMAFRCQACKAAIPLKSGMALSQVYRRASNHAGREHPDLIEQDLPDGE